VVDEATYAPTMRERDSYEKGKTPRVEIVVDDVDVRVAKFVKAGATVQSQKEGGRALVVDPFGHVWAIAPADEDEGPEPWV